MKTLYIPLILAGIYIVFQSFKTIGTLKTEKQAYRLVKKEAGFEIRQAGCSACLGMNEDKVPAGEYCVSTSNRNFEGRQGAGARTLLASPLTAAAAALTGVVTDVRTLL